MRLEGRPTTDDTRCHLVVLYPAAYKAGTTTVEMPRVLKQSQKHAVRTPSSEKNHVSSSSKAPCTPLQEDIHPIINMGRLEKHQSMSAVAPHGGELPAPRLSLNLDPLY